MLATLVLTVLSSTASAGKVPATVNVGIGPTMAWLGDPLSGVMTPSVGVSLQAEGWVSKKTLRSKKVMKRVPKQYRGMVKGMPDAHVTPVPVMLVPDIVGILPLTSEDSTAPSVVPVSWSPLSASFLHEAKGTHVSVDVQPRLTWLRMEDAGGQKANAAWLGATLQPEIQTAMKRRLGVAVGGRLGGGWVPEPTTPLQDYTAPWLHADAYARLQVRIPIEVSM